MLTLEKLKAMESNTIFASGVTDDSRLYKDPVRWVAVRGGIWDWAIYYHTPEHTEYYIKRSGDKCYIDVVIKELVHCDDEAFAMYRH